MRAGKIPLIIFLVAIAITVPSIIIFYAPVDGEELHVVIDPDPQLDPEPTECTGMSSTDKILCDKLDKILENQEQIMDSLSDIYDLGS